MNRGIVWRFEYLKIEKGFVMKIVNLCALTCVGFAVGFAVGLASGEIITGEHPDEYLRFPGGGPGDGEIIDGLGVALYGYSWDTGSKTSSVHLGAFTDSSERSVGFLRRARDNGQGSYAYFLEGQGLASGLLDDDELRIGGISHSDSGPDNWSLFGSIGEMMYVGFVVHEQEGALLDNYGFLQIQKESDRDFRIIGWAYESQSGVDLVAYNLVPSPSGLAVLGFAGLGLTRRRRR